MLRAMTAMVVLGQAHVILENISDTKPKQKSTVTACAPRKSVGQNTTDIWKGVRIASLLGC